MRAYLFSSYDQHPTLVLNEWANVALFASSHPYDALKYAHGPFLQLVEIESLTGYTDAYFARRCKLLKTCDATELLHRFARWCAVNVTGLWNAPPIVRDYLSTGDEEKRPAAEAEIKKALKKTKQAQFPAVIAALYATTSLKQVWKVALATATEAQNAVARAWTKHAPAKMKRALYKDCIKAHLATQRNQLRQLVDALFERETS